MPPMLTPCPVYLDPAPLQERAALLEHMQRTPDKMWRTCTIWNFRNEAKVYGSPMFDSVYLPLAAPATPDPLPAVLEHLRKVALPWN